MDLKKPTKGLFAEAARPCRLEDAQAVGLGYAVMAWIAIAVIVGAIVALH
jgi:hypothetical protein